jgi:DNA-binding LytR/AlgR family response regulator
VLPQPAIAQGLWHLGLATAFALAWYVGSRVVLAFGAAALTGQPFRMTGFYGPVLAWQLFQGLVLYAAVAAIIYAQQQRLRAAAGVERAAAADPPSLERYLIRSGEDFRPVDVGEIITITGAQDYSEVATAAGRHLVRLSVGQFESRLDPNRFIRVHRSTIIHLAHLERAELAGGGRMLAHMRNGDCVPVSRAGVKALRALIV